MDTRQKIAPAPATVVLGHFDPVTSEHANRLQELKQQGKPLIVVVTSPSDPLLPARARAELVAALRVVDQVIIADEFISEEQADDARRDALMEHIRSRQ